MPKLHATLAEAAPVLATKGDRIQIVALPNIAMPNDQLSTWQCQHANCHCYVQFHRCFTIHLASANESLKLTLITLY
jgi:hypothetical protein